MIYNFIKKYREKDISSYAASLSFYFFISFGSLMVVLASVIGFFSNQEAFKYYLDIIVSFLFGDIASTTINFFLADNPTLFAYSLVGLFVLIVSSTTAITHLQHSLNRVMGFEEDDGIKGALSRRIYSLVIIMFFCFIVIALLSLSAILNFVIGVFSSFALISFTLTFLLVTSFYLALYRYLPKQKKPFRKLYKPALLGATFYLVGKFFLELYFSFISISDLIALLVAFMLFVFYVNFTILFGALWVK